MEHRNPRLAVSRREMLTRIGAGFGTMGLAGMLAEENSISAAEHSVDPLAVKPPHFAPKAKSVIQLFMPGGPSQVDTFDYKPHIGACEGQRPELVNRKSLRNTKNGLMPSPFGFQQYGECGKWVSDIFPEVVYDLFGGFIKTACIRDMLPSHEVRNCMPRDGK